MVPEWQSPPPPKRRRWPIALGSIVAVVALAAAAFVVLDPLGDDVTWDPEIERLAEFVERERGLDFDHPVEVEFVDADAYTRSFRQQAELDDQALADLADFFAAMRAMGLVSSEFDAKEVVQEYGGEGTVGFYDYEAERLVVKGVGLSPYVRGTVVHELTHALDDQHFDLGRAFEENDLTDGEVFALRSVSEGDAVTTEQAYVESLPAAQQDRYAEEESGEIEGADLAAVPEAVLLGESAPYTFGPPLVWVAEERWGDAGRNRLFEAPPRSEEQVIDPTAFLGGDTPADVATPALDAAAEEVGSGDFGMLTLAIMLGERIEPRRTVDAALGWNGDSYVIFREDDRICLQGTFVGDGEANTTEIADALADWAAAMPSGAASTERTGDAVSVRSCDPGANVPKGTGGGAEASGLLALRASSYAEVYGESGDEEVATCVADASLDLYDRVGTQILDEASELDPELANELTQWAVQMGADCGA